MGTLGPFGVNEAHASWIGNMASGIFKKAAAAIGSMILSLVGVVLAAAAQLFDASIRYSLYDINNNKVIDAGWAMSRDIANLFFIFILLYISITTILQIGEYGTKDLLVKVIVIALLVNFSLVFTKVIIDASNILAVGFYEKMENIPVVDSAGAPIYKNGKQKTVSLSEAFVGGLRPQGAYDTNIGKTVKTSETGATTTINSAQEATLLQIFIQTVMGSALILVAAFVMFSGAIMFVLRVVSLWIIMILAPLAFVAMALPYTGQYAKKWWNTLFKQAFFAPIFLFMMYFAVKIVTSKTLSKQLGIDTARSGNAGFFKNNQMDVKLILNYVMLIALFLAVLTVANELGGKSSSLATGWAHKGRKWAQGKAKRYSMRGTGAASEGALRHAYDVDEDGNYKNKKLGAMMLRGAFKIPGAARGAARASSWRERQMEETKKKREKTYGSYSEAGLEALSARRFIRPPKREVIEEKLGGKRTANEEKGEIKKDKEELKKLKLRQRSEEWGKKKKEIEGRRDAHKNKDTSGYSEVEKWSWERETKKLDNELAEFMKDTYDKKDEIEKKLRQKKESAVIKEAQKIIKQAASGAGKEAPKPAPETKKA